MSLDPSRLDRQGNRWPTVVARAVIAGWLLLYAWRTLAGHLSLATNAFDLSVFDYALWSLERGGHGFVPFMGQSIFSHHFMPLLWVITPLHALAPSPVTLLMLQLLAAAVAALLFLRIQREQGLHAWLAVGLMTVFLLSRRTHGAVAGSFYPEAFQAPLTFAMVLLWPSRRAWLWPCLILLLMTKEDAAVYVAAFAVLAIVRGIGPRTQAVGALGLALAWLAFAVLVAIPASRTADGLPAANPFLEARYGVVDGQVDSTSLRDRLFGERTARTILNLTASAGFLPLAGVTWVAPAVPGILANLLAPPDGLQSALIGHYAWPILPWIFLAASAGARWMQQRSKRLAAVWVGLLLVVTAVDNPAMQRMVSTGITAEARLVRTQLLQVRGETILAQPNVIPHLPKTSGIFAIGGVAPASAPDWVLITTVGDLWPLTPEAVQSMITTYRQDDRYVEVVAGPLFAFKRRPGASPPNPRLAHSRDSSHLNPRTSRTPLARLTR